MPSDFQFPVSSFQVLVSMAQFRVHCVHRFMPPSIHPAHIMTKDYHRYTNYIYPPNKQQTTSDFPAHERQHNRQCFVGIPPADQTNLDTQAGKEPPPPLSLLPLHHHHITVGSITIISHHITPAHVPVRCKRNHPNKKNPKTGRWRWRWSSMWR